jgi:hypothetical protein
MFGEMPETTVMMRMEQLRAEVEQERLARIARQAAQSSNDGKMKRRTASLPRLLLQWWDALTQHRRAAARPMSVQGTSTCT